MKNTKRCFCNFSFYDQESIQEKLETMASKGWMVEKLSNMMWTYKRIEPKQLRFAVTYFPDASEFDPGPTEGELTKMDFCAQDGWILAVRWGAMQIFYNENLDAIPIETDPVASVNNIHTAMKKNVLRTHLFSIAMLIYYLTFQFFRMKDDPIEYLSNPFYLYSIPMFAALLVSSIHEIIYHFAWYKKAKKTAENDGIFLPLKSKPLASYSLLAFSALCMLLAYSGFRTSNRTIVIALVYLAIMLLVFAIGNGIKAALKRKGASRGFNLIVSTGTVTLLTFVALALLCTAIITGDFTLWGKKQPIATYDINGWTMEVYDDPLPLEIEDMSAADAIWSKEADYQETFLASYRKYNQDFVHIEGNDAGETKDLQYSIIDVKVPVLFDFMKQAILNSRQDEVHDDFIFTDHYEQIDPTIWQADDAYQVYWSDSLLNTYLLCWDNRIVEIKFYWEPTPEQIAVAIEKLVP